MLCTAADSADQIRPVPSQRDAVRTEDVRARRHSRSAGSRRPRRRQLGTRFTVVLFLFFLCLLLYE